MAPRDPLAFWCNESGQPGGDRAFGGKKPPGGMVRPLCRQCWCGECGVVISTVLQRSEVEKRTRQRLCGASFSDELGRLLQHTDLAIAASAADRRQISEE